MKNNLPTTTDPNHSIIFNNNIINSDKDIANAFNKSFTNPKNFTCMKKTSKNLTTPQPKHHTNNHYHQPRTDSHQKL